MKGSGSATTRTNHMRTRKEYDKAVGKGLKNEPGLLEKIMDLEDLERKYAETLMQTRASIAKNDKSVVAKALFDLWAETYSQDMGSHLAAAESVIDKAETDICDRIKRRLEAKKGADKSTITMMDLSVGTGEEALHVVNLILNNFEKVNITFHMRDISDEMLSHALRQDWPKDRLTIIPKVANLLTPDEEDMKLYEKVDVLNFIQTLDVMRFCDAKRNALQIIYSYLAVGGIGLVIGEHPSRFELGNNMSMVKKLLFMELFQEGGWDKAETSDEIVKTAGGRFMIVSDASTNIDGKHSMFILVPEKIFKPSSDPTKYLFIPRQNNGHAGGCRDI